ncbi:hypothetical protein, partial [Robinsoniella sp.]|uniref:hypothetical protein n=1 Tax=Robinsoniella sp. TaxID=2496533 RepID=UPI00374FFD29
VYFYYLPLFSFFFIFLIRQFQQFINLFFSLTRRVISVYYGFEVKFAQIFCMVTIHQVLFVGTQSKVPRKSKPPLQATGHQIAQRAAGYLTLAAVAKWTRQRVRLARCSRK